MAAALNSNAATRGPAANTAEAQTFDITLENCEHWWKIDNEKTKQILKDAIVIRWTALKETQW
jgi:hypothetical protein